MDGKPREFRSWQSQYTLGGARFPLISQQINLQITLQITPPAAKFARETGPVVTASRTIPFRNCNRSTRASRSIAWRTAVRALASPSWVGRVLQIQRGCIHEAVFETKLLPGPISFRDHDQPVAARVLRSVSMRNSNEAEGEIQGGGPA